MSRDTKKSEQHNAPSARRITLREDSELPPNPQFAREQWMSLDGTWDFALDPTGKASFPEDVTWDRSITVPFPPESRLSGIDDRAYHLVVWYRRQFSLPQGWESRDMLLRFGAVDYSCTVWIDGFRVGSHEGGHTSFSFDITAALSAAPGSKAANGRHEIVVRAEDDPLEMDKPRGKQDWQREPHGIWYPRTTGIWQPVWLEATSAIRIEGIRVTPNLARLCFEIEADINLADGAEDVALDIVLRFDDELIAEQAHAVSSAGGGTLHPKTISTSIHLFDPGIDDAKRKYLWSPDRPALFDLELRVRRNREVLDQVLSYAGMRSVETTDSRFLLNGKPLFLRMVLDQGYWQDGLLAAPDGAALRNDVELAKKLGFNGARKHQKIEDPRYLFWADKLGLLVWEELPGAYGFSARSVRRIASEWQEAIERDRNHPCIICWVPFNESWGLPDLQHDERHRHLVHTLYHLTKSLDSSRPVVGNDGWEHVASDLLTVHDYTTKPDDIDRRYGEPGAMERTVREYRPGGRAVLTPDVDASGRAALLTKPLILSEFGGIRFAPGSDGWGYDQVGDPQSLIAKYRSLVAAASSRALAGFCYTQLTDTFQEQNGLADMERVPKADTDQIASATRAT